jgi:hypothetical protein
MEQNRRIIMGSFPSGFQRIVFIFWRFRGFAINESQIKTLPAKTGVKAWQMLKFFMTINTLSGLTF